APEQDAQRLAQRPVPPPAALDLDPGAAEPAASRPAQAPRTMRPARPARPAWAAAGPAPAGGRLGGPQVAGGLGLPVHLSGGFPRASRRVRVCVSAVPSAPGRAAGIGAHRGADTAALHAMRP